MITCKEDLLKTFVKFDENNPDIFYVYTSLCDKFGIRRNKDLTASDWLYCNDYLTIKSLHVTATGMVGDNYDTNNSEMWYTNRSFKELTLNDLTMYASKTPKDMTVDEFKAFINDRIDGISMQYKKGELWYDCNDQPTMQGRCRDFDDDVIYRVRPPLTEEEKQIKDKRAEIFKLQDEIAHLEKPNDRV